MDTSTLPPEIAWHLPPALVDDAWGLAVLWSRHDPGQVGEVLMVPSGGPDPWIFGRGTGDGSSRRIFLARWTSSGPSEPRIMSCPRISRNQLRLWEVNGGLGIENVGSCPLTQQGSELNRGELAPGDTVFLHNELLLLCVRRPWRSASALVELAVPHHEFGCPDQWGLVGESAAMWELRERLVSVGNQPLHLLILGASGTGKELVAQALHVRSSRRTRALVARNAATIPEGIADAELFGNVRGYPNVGMPERPGLLGAAHESTLFLDEIAELPLPLQVKLLRVLDSGEYQRLGEAAARRADVRVIGATNRPVTALRHDVLARFALQLSVPDLNARREDIPLLITHLLHRHRAQDPATFLRFFPERDLGARPRVSPTLVESLVAHQYTTNVRELDALLMAAVLRSPGAYVEGSPSMISTRPPSEPSKPTWLTAEEGARLKLQRQHRFTPTDCGRDPSYPGNRQTADLHFRHLACKAMLACELDVDRAASLIAGELDGPLFEKCQARLATFMTNLEARIVDETPEQLDHALMEDWRGLVAPLRLVIEALRTKRETLATTTLPLRSA